MKSATLSQLFAVCAVTLFTATAAQAGDNCILSSLTHATAEEGTKASTHVALSSAQATTQDQDMADTIAPLVGGMAKRGIHTATSVMRTLTHEASLMLQE